MVRTALLTLTIILVNAPLALAADDGEGLWGETSDKTVTMAAFIVICGFPLLIALISALQGSLDRRKDRKLKAAKARRARADVRGGW
jgi:uncharacterized membrane protein YphA (DoxX/SURF4 family)